MGLPVLVMGKSGSGKSASLRNFTRENVRIINVLGKQFPFRGELKSIVSDDYAKIKQMLLETAVKTIVIDDAGYLITNEFMRRNKEKGYEKFTELANNYYELVNFIQYQLPPEKIVYLFMHTDESDNGSVKPKTIGRLLDEKVCIEGMFTIVLLAEKSEKNYVFRTQTTGYDVTKSPMGLFKDEEIDNDLSFVDSEIRKYYGLVIAPVTPTPPPAPTEPTVQPTQEDK